MAQKQTIAAVVIPVYKEDLSENEMLSLKQCIRILSGHPLCLVAPEGLKLDAYFAHYADFEVFRFKKAYFKNVSGYNQLLLSFRFYQKFSFTKYILIYQLDAYVFRDDLMAWCNKDYVYIGAPWIIKPPQIKENIKVDLGKYLLHKVGNGGFSLRKVKTHFWTSLIFWPLTRLFIKNEDFFWSVIAPEVNPFYKVPSMEEAIDFAFELAPQQAFQMNQGKLPFGCHAWEKYDPEFWAPFIHPPQKTV